VLIRQMLVVLLFGFWIVLFALPFARDAAAEPELLDLPPLDEKDYFAGYYNAYGLYEALDYLRENGISQGQQVYVIQGTRFCLPDYYGFAAHMDMLCEKRFYRGDVDLKPLINDDAVFYLITDAPPLDLAVSGFHVNQVAVFNKPSGDIQITIWRLSVAD
ncbi:MAG TPA: hypothetical protein VJZ27_15450, partial [Aggregatilineales bacterium]|nr:hypothetical protein [Aggregatilineales bacterium]